MWKKKWSMWFVALDTTLVSYSGAATMKIRWIFHNIVLSIAYIWSCVTIALSIPLLLVFRILLWLGVQVLWWTTVFFMTTLSEPLSGKRSGCSFVFIPNNLPIFMLWHYNRTTLVSIGHPVLPMDLSSMTRTEACSSRDGEQLEIPNLAIYTGTNAAFWLADKSHMSANYIIQSYS